MSVVAGAASVLVGVGAASVRVDACSLLCALVGAYSLLCALVGASVLLSALVGARKCSLCVLVGACAACGCVGAPPLLCVCRCFFALCFSLLVFAAVRSPSLLLSTSVAGHESDPELAQRFWPRTAQLSCTLWTAHVEITKNVRQGIPIQSSK